MKVDIDILEMLLKISGNNEISNQQGLIDTLRRCSNGCMKCGGEVRHFNYSVKRMPTGFALTADGKCLKCGVVNNNSGERHVLTNDLPARFIKGGSKK
jgi:hypothetical protein